MKFLITLLTLICSESAWSSGMGAELSGMIRQGGVQSSSASDSANYYGEFRVGYGLQKFNFLQFNIAASTLQGNEMGTSGNKAFNINLIGGGLQLIPFKSGFIGIGVNYYPQMSIIESTTTSEIYREGTGTGIDVSLYVPINQKWRAGFRFQYITVSSDSKTISGVDTTDSWSRSFLNPAATLVYGF